MDSTPEAVMATPAPVHYPKFHGETGTYFRIWIINVLLTIITFGIYSAWAKVRTLKFMYGSTELAGSRFDFHGPPIPILVGRIIALFLFMLYAYSSAIHPVLSIIGTVALFLAIPFLFVKSLKFRMANTSYRNIRFAFKGKVKDAYKIWFRHLSVMAAAVIINGFIIWLSDFNPEEKTSSTIATAFIILGIFLAGLIYTLAILSRFMDAVFHFVYNNIYYGGSKAHISSSREQVSLQIIRPQVIGYTAIIAGPILLLLFGGLLSSLISLPALMAVLAVVALSTVYLGALCLGFYLHYSILTYVWNRLSLNQQKTHIRVQLKKYISISLTNLFAMIFSLGLLYPWAKIRFKKYIIENRGLEIADFDNFIAESEQQASALGEEVADIFDYDFELGL